MTREEFEALLKMEGKELRMGKADGHIYMASVVVGENIAYNYAYGKTQEEATQKLIARHYADN